MAHCSCVYVGEGDNYPEFINSKQVKARLEHKCSECNETIQPGDTYTYISGKWYDSGFHQFKTCLTCDNIMDEFFCDGFSYGVVYKDLHNHIQEHQGQISELCLSNLLPSARSVVCDMIEKYWEE